MPNLLHLLDHLNKNLNLREHHFPKVSIISRIKMRMCLSESNNMSPKKFFVKGTIYYFYHYIYSYGTDYSSIGYQQGTSMKVKNNIIEK